ncbi:unnamed protein product [Dibothriocephalus latus]|uniref:Uncharacterized protein n=1 Tax=Dibothriocephalus latus TaxID=60516 RepID=A0A3P7MMA8_DIBLA|nr:unnamed protein product [Dibothriocephalus latus]
MWVEDCKLLPIEIQEPSLEPRLQSAQVILQSFPVARTLNDLPELNVIGQHDLTTVHFLKALITGRRSSCVQVAGWHARL